MKKRHERISREMKRRRFAVNKNLDIGGFERKFKNDWTPTEKDLRVIKNRLIEKIKMKSDWYRYYGDVKDKKFFVKLLEE